MQDRILNKSPENLNLAKNKNNNELSQNIKPIKLLEQSIAKHIQDGGSLSVMTNSFEQRITQVNLLLSIIDVFNNSGIGVFEAGTGVGKSFAYLLPAMEWAYQNNERIVISTGTINLQQQLLEKDIPLTKKMIHRDLKCILLKGRHNYICKRRLSDLTLETQFSLDLFEDTDKEEVKKIIKWEKTTADGSRSHLPFVPKDSLWSKICSESDACMGLRCPFNEDCFVMKMRNEAKSAHILIVNHHLLFADIEMRLHGFGYEDVAVLPPYKHIVLDEAHTIENAATSFFSEYITRFKINRHLSFFWKYRKKTFRGFLPLIKKYLKDEQETKIAIKLIKDIKISYENLEKEALLILGNFQSIRMNNVNTNKTQNLFFYCQLLKKNIFDFVSIIKEIIDDIETSHLNESILWETNTVLKRIESIGTFFSDFSDWEKKENTIFWMEKIQVFSHSSFDKQNEWYPRFVATPLSVAKKMKQGIFDVFDTIICTSATLRISNSFEFWLNRTGISMVSARKVYTNYFDSPFPYASNVLLNIPVDAPFPDNIEFQDFINTAIFKLIQASDGRTLVLFTSYESLSLACLYTREYLDKHTYTVLKQGEDDRFRTLEQFLSDEQSVLFATDSFWEGIDVPGDALLQVIIVKLPFSVPNDPVHQARSEALEKVNKNPFMELTLPEAVIKFKQGFGRLMRKSTDRGIITVLDKRILVKRYGRIFLDSVPKTQTFFEPLDLTITKIDRFLFN